MSWDISIDILDKASIDAAIKEVERARLAALEAVKNAKNRLADEAGNTAKQRFAGVAYTGTNDTTVQVIHSATAVDNASVVASGSSTWFAEFGTGVTYNGDTSPSTFEAPPGMVGIGKYGAGHGSDEEGWFYPANFGGGGDATLAKGGKAYHTYGFRGANAMGAAFEDMNDNAETVLKEELERGGY